MLSPLKRETKESAGSLKKLLSLVLRGQCVFISGREESKIEENN